ncbi:hypothetical protein N0V85_007158 [Neurospora sp. IMI 360204]|nr:hypothetical protein N0V85_007158 [Neurospora sp. IMI 360204]
MSNTELRSRRYQCREIAVISPMCDEAPTRVIDVSMIRQGVRDVFMIQEAFSLIAFRVSALSPLHSFIGSPLALGDRRQQASTVASPHIEEWEATVDLPYPAVKCVITQVTHASPDQRCWAVLVLGAFYDANDSILWQTEIFLGDTAEDSEETYEDSYSVSDTEEDQTISYLDTYENDHENDFNDAHSETGSEDSDFAYLRQRARILARINESAAQQDHWVHNSSYPVPSRLWDPIQQTWVDVYPQGHY